MIKNRVTKLEQAIIPRAGFTVLEIRWDHKEEDEERLIKEHITNGGNPNDRVIFIVNFSDMPAGREEARE